MNKIVLFIILIFISRNLKAQSNLQQITFGVGAGAATAYTGTQLQKTTLAWLVNAGYYPNPFFNINIEGQAGSMAGAAPNAQSIDHKSFNNNYRAAILNAEFKAGLFFDYQKSDFLNAVKNIYIGTGFGLLNNNIINVNINDLQVTDHIKNTIQIIPFKLGYEFNLLNRYKEPKLKADLSYSFNYTIGRGLDGYYDSNTKALYFYNYYTVGLKYAVSLVNRSGKRRYKLQ